jgi:hypothetical protein
MLTPSGLSTSSGGAPQSPFLSGRKGMALKNGDLVIFIFYGFDIHVLYGGGLIHLQ